MAVDLQAKHLRKDQPTRVRAQGPDGQWRDIDLPTGHGRRYGQVIETVRSVEATRVELYDQNGKLIRALNDDDPPDDEEATVGVQVGPTDPQPLLFATQTVLGMLDRVTKPFLQTIEKQSAALVQISQANSDAQAKTAKAMGKLAKSFSSMAELATTAIADTAVAKMDLAEQHAKGADGKEPANKLEDAIANAVPEIMGAFAGKE